MLGAGQHFISTLNMVRRLVVYHYEASLYQLTTLNSFYQKRFWPLTKTPSLKMSVDTFRILYLVFAASQNPFLKRPACDPHAKTPLIRMSPQRYQDGKMLIHQMTLTTEIEGQLYGTPM